MTDETTLPPCPFCGGEADEYEGEYGNGIYCMMCGAMMGEPIHLGYRTTKRVSIDEAIAAWNTRAERTCEPKWVLQGETQTQEFWRCECGNCGECFGVEDRSSFPFKMTIDKVEIPNFCQKCGCKVVDE